MSIPFARRLGAVVSLAVAPYAADAQSFRVASPDGRNVVTLAVDRGVLTYAVDRGPVKVIVPSRLGFAFRGAATLQGGVVVTDSARTSRDTTFLLPWGEVARVREHYRELRVGVQEQAGAKRRFAVVVRAFDDGIGFRYELPAQPGLDEFLMDEELTEFTFAEDAKAWWIPANVPSPDRQEMLWSSGPISKLDTVHTPLTVQMTTGTQVVVHEADLVDYAGMYLVGRSESRTLRASLAKWKDGVAVRGRTPFVTPWRTIQLADRPEQLAPSLLTLKLNPPSRIADTRWIRPMKYNGIWWGMHVNTMTWGQGPLHGATTANTRRYLDFAGANGLGGTLVEGWNVGWDGDWMKTGDRFSFTQPYPDYDLPGLAAYAKGKGLSLIVHNETATFIENYERQLDSAFALYQRLGVTAIKTGYVNDTTHPGGHAHQSQYMVRHHRRVIETAAKYGIAVDMHEPIKDTGERRTWPNMLASRRASSTSRSPAAAPTSRALPRTRGHARPSPSSSRSTSCCTRRSRWPPICPRTTRGSRPSASSATSPSTGTRRSSCTAGSVMPWSSPAGRRGRGSGSSARSPTKRPARSRSRSPFSAAAAGVPRCTPTARAPTGEPHRRRSASGPAR
ncbi:MAG: glycoside hydrolase family 97 catalytic domain-containing protein [Gemmatimonadaceae bacterium]|nr:glycoside hydrolase family 97 catalytic domain-containing protein [Gemmatimonadaceae bacterium]